MDWIRDCIGPIRSGVRRLFHDVLSIPILPHGSPRAIGIRDCINFHCHKFHRRQRSWANRKRFIVAVKLCILGLFAAAGLIFAKPEYLAPSLWPAASGILFGAGVLFIGYEGFGSNHKRRGGHGKSTRSAAQSALSQCDQCHSHIYLAVSVAVIGNLRIEEIVAAKDYALAAAAKPFLGQFGFRLIAIGALFSTASAINATLFGAANVSYMIARDGELPKIFSRSHLAPKQGGLLITSALVIMFILFFDLSGVAMMGSGAFLLIYACVHCSTYKNNI